MHDAAPANGATLSIANRDRYSSSSNSSSSSRRMEVSTLRLPLLRMLRRLRLPLLVVVILVVFLLTGMGLPPIKPAITEQTICLRFMLAVDVAADALASLVVITMT